jgi:hypothetical protein
MLKMASAYFESASSVRFSQSTASESRPPSSSKSAKLCQAEAHLIAFNAEHFRRILAKYAIYYNEVRTHTSLGKDPPCTRPIERLAGYIIGTLESDFGSDRGERAVARAAEQFGTMFGRLLPFRRLVDFQYRREISLAQLGRLGLELMLKLSQLGFIGIAGFRKPGDLVRGLDKLQHGQFGALHGSAGRPERCAKSSSASRLLSGSLEASAVRTKDG